MKKIKKILFELKLKIIISIDKFLMWIGCSEDRERYNKWK